MSGTHTAIIEALLLATDRPLTAVRIASVVPHLKADSVPPLIEELNRAYADGGRAFRVREVAGGYRLYAQPEYQSHIEALAVTSREARLSQAALETLAVVAYRQPTARGDIEYVRGCDCDGVLRTLLTRKLIAIKGRSEAPGRPLLYVTTDRFLEYFGLARLDDLPDWSEIAAMVGDPPTRTSLTLVRGPEERVSEPSPAAPVEAIPDVPEPVAVAETVLAASEDEPAEAELELVGAAVPPGDET
jgi:segregation and condensation protein B